MRRACPAPAGPTPIAPEDDAPLIITADLDDASFAYLDDLRMRYFPARLNKVPAHVSLFHHLPCTALRTVTEAVANLCAEREGFDLRPTKPRFLGRGVALAYESSELLACHGALARQWAPWLTAQDRQPFRPHVTIQNKVPPNEARALYERIRMIEPQTCRVEGIRIWRYLGGPWAHVSTIRFGGQPQPDSRGVVSDAG